MSRGFLLDTGLWDKSTVDEYAVLNRLFKDTPVSLDVMEKEVDASFDRREDREILLPVISALSGVFVEALLSSKSEFDDDEIANEMMSLLESGVVKLSMTAVLSGFAFGITSQLIETNLIKKGWE
jgi:hypothetical protein